MLLRTSLLPLFALLIGALLLTAPRTAEAQVEGDHIVVRLIMPSGSDAIIQVIDENGSVRKETSEDLSLKPLLGSSRNNEDYLRESGKVYGDWLALLNEYKEDGYQLITSYKENSSSIVVLLARP